MEHRLEISGVQEAQTKVLVGSGKNCRNINCELDSKSYCNCICDGKCICDCICNCFCDCNCHGDCNGNYDEILTVIDF